MFMERVSLWELDQKAVNGVPAAIENAMHFTGEVLQTLQKLATEKAA
jgi:chromosome partitioning protein